MLKKMAALLFCAVLCFGLHAQSSGRTHHVIFVVTSPDQADWQTGLVLADHYMAGVKPDVTDIEVLAYGPGIPMLAKGAPDASQLAELQKKGVHFVACENAMRAFKIQKADLLPGVTSVPSGVVELVSKQEAGFSYVKVGR